MVHILSEEHIYKTSFSKYGTAYQSMIYPKLKQEVSHHAETIFRGINDSIRITGDSQLTVTAGKDGIHAENDEDTSLDLFIFLME